MGTYERNQAAFEGSADAGWDSLCRMGGAATFILMAYSLATMVQLVVFGGQPTTAAEAFSLLQSNRVLGLLRLDLPTVLALPLYYVVFLGLFSALSLNSEVRSTCIRVERPAICNVFMAFRGPTAPNKQGTA